MVIQDQQKTARANCFQNDLVYNYTGTPFDVSNMSGFLTISNLRSTGAGMQITLSSITNAGPGGAPQLTVIVTRTDDIGAPSWSDGDATFSILLMEMPK